MANLLIQSVYQIDCVLRFLPQLPQFSFHSLAFSSQAFNSTDTKVLRNTGTDSASLCSLAGRYDNPFPTRFLPPIDCSTYNASTASISQLKFPSFRSSPSIPHIPFLTFHSSSSISDSFHLSSFIHRLLFLNFLSPQLPFLNFQSSASILQLPFLSFHF